MVELPDLVKTVIVIYFQLNLVDFENNPELKKLKFLAPGPKMAGLTKGNSLSKKEGNIKEGRRQSSSNLRVPVGA